MVDDAGDWQDLSAGGVSLLGVAPVAGHPPDVAVLLFGPDCCLEGEPFLGCEGSLVVGVELSLAGGQGEEEADCE